MPTSLTGRTISLLKKDGYDARNCEEILRFPDKNRPACPTCKARPVIVTRRDFYGVADVAAFRWTPNTTDQLLVQVTDSNRVTGHVSDLLNLKGDALLLLLRVGFRVEVHGWLEPSQKVRNYRLRVVEFELRGWTQIVSHERVAEDHPSWPIYSAKQNEE